MKRNLFLIFTVITITFASILFLNINVFPEGYGDMEISFMPDEQIKQFDVLEFDINFRDTFNNPFNPDEINITAHFIRPDNSERVVPAFYYQDFSQKVYGKRGFMTPKDDPVWKVRFTPSDPGSYRVYVTVELKNKKLRTKEKRVEVFKTNNPGFVRTAGTRYLYFDSGETFFGIGENVAWTFGNINKYDSLFDKLSKNGCNLVRVWMVPWNLGLEGKKDNIRKIEGFSGVGRYNLRNAWKLDQILASAEKKGIYVILVLGSYSELMDDKGSFNEQEWEENPYNKRVGGPCTYPADFWTDKKAGDYYKKRLRYITARWGYSKSILAFELWNEVNAPVSWVKEMSEYLKKIDAYKHLVTTSLGMLKFTGFDETKIWELPSLDFTQLHIYGFGGTFIDLVDRINYKINRYTTEYDKPSFVGEYGIGGEKSDKFYDPEGKGLHIHNCLWAGLFSQSFSGAMNWWRWEDNIDSKHIYERYRTFASFVEYSKLMEDGPIESYGNRDTWDSVRVEVYSETDGKEKRPGKREVSVPVISEWGQKDEREIEIMNDGTLNGGRLNTYLHGMDKEDIRVCPVFKVNYPDDGEFIISVSEVSINAGLNVYLDGKKVFSREFPLESADGKGDWKKRKYREDWGIYQYEYHEDYKIEVPQGPHIIRLENSGLDWLSIDKITLTNYMKGLSAAVRVFGLRRGKRAIFWVQDMESTWFNEYSGIEPGKINGTMLEIYDMPDGEYNACWWDTWKGKIIHTERVFSSSKKMLLKVPPFKRDIALIVEEI